MKSANAIFRDGYQVQSSKEPVIVQCDGFRCMAYRDKEGQWRDYFCNDELPSFQHVVEAD